MNEFKHKSAGFVLTQAEDDGIDRHQFDSQAIGDILYASSPTQLRRLPIGTGILIVSGGIPVWSTTLPAVTLGGALDVAGQYLTFLERAAPGAGAADTARVYAVVGGDTLTDLAAVFQDGTVDIFAQEATDPDSPIFQFPDNTELKTIMRKPDRKTIQFVAQFPDGREFVMREIQYPNERWN